LIARVNSAGLLTTVQDCGRWGYQSRGVPVAGPMDRVSLRLANAIVGNKPTHAALEVTLAGPRLEFADRRMVAVVGAEFENVPPGVAFEVSPTNPLIFGRRLRGARAYVAISGGIDVPLVLGSRATHLPSAMGGFEGRALRAGDELPLGPPQRGHYLHEGLNSSGVSALRRTEPALRVLPGPQADRFVKEALDVLQSAPYRVDVNSNRVGYRLSGPRLQHLSGADILSDATPIGAIQVPASGEPILLMADCQTTGGYAKIATVISADTPAAGQLAPGDEIRFVVCSLPEAMNALRMQSDTLRALEQR
jgi:antagonist of KipI